jgi:hypothetical protein
MPRTPAVKRILFVHLGRTGGTTLRQHVLYKCVRRESIFNVGVNEPPARHGTVEDLLAMPPQEQKKLRVISGHMPFGLRERLACPETWGYLTFLRDPVARTVSEYYQVRESSTNPAHPKGMMHNLEEFVRRRCGLGRNGMCRLLSNQAYGRRFESEEAMFEEALRNAEACSFIGLTEFYADSVRRLCQLCGWTVPDFGRQHRLTPKGRQLSDGELEAIHANNVLDQKLYDHCREWFLKRPVEQERKPALIHGLLKKLWPKQQGKSAA